MNDLNSEIQQKILTWISGIENLAVTELPTFITEFCNYYFWSNMATIFGIVIFFIVSLYVFKKCLGYINEQLKETYPSDGVVIPCFITMLLLLICNGVFLYDLLCLTKENIKISLCPKIFVLEYFTGKK